MPYDPNKHHRRSIRHPQHDYATPGAYFVTVCTQGRAYVLADPALAAICTDVWFTLPAWFPTIALDEFIIMPNHSHLVVWLGIGESIAEANKIVEGAYPCGRPDDEDDKTPWDWEIPEPQSQRTQFALGDVIGAWKSLTTTTCLSWIKKHNLDRQAKFWQRNYYDRIIRNDRALEAIRLYIRENPMHWDMDPDNPHNTLRLPPPESIDDYIEDIRRDSRR